MSVYLRIFKPRTEPVEEIISIPIDCQATAAEIEEALDCGLYDVEDEEEYPASRVETAVAS